MGIAPFDDLDAYAVRRHPRAHEELHGDAATLCLRAVSAYEQRTVRAFSDDVTSFSPQVLGEGRRKPRIRWT
jgi:hypothetical protein